MGYCLKTLRDGKEISYRGDERFPTASTIKTAVMVEVVKQVDEGKLKWGDKRTVPSDMSKRQGSMWSYYFKDGTTLTVDGWVNLMITVSDNTATMVLREWLTPDAVNTRMAGLGLTNTKVLMNGMARELDQRHRGMFGLGMTTPREMARLLEMIYKNKAASVEGCDRMIQILSHQYWDDGIGWGIPRDVKVASKSGAIERSRSDTAIVFSDNPYILTIYTDNQKDRRWSESNEGSATIRRMGSLIWNYLHPSRQYTPPKGAGKFAPNGGLG